MSSGRGRPRAAGGGPADPPRRPRGRASRAPLCGPAPCRAVRAGSEAHEPAAHGSVFPPPLGIEELCQKREELCRQIQQEEDEKQRLQNEVRQLTEKLARVNENLARKIASRNEFDRTIAETEAAYLKVGLSAVCCQCLARLRGCRPDGGAVCGIRGSEQRCMGKSTWCGPELLGFAGRA